MCTNCQTRETEVSNVRSERKSADNPGSVCTETLRKRGAKAVGREREHQEELRQSIPLTLGTGIPLDHREIVPLRLEDPPREPLTYQPLYSYAVYETSIPDILLRQVQYRMGTLLWLLLG